MAQLSAGGRPEMDLAPHGSHYLLGAYLALTLLTRTGSYVVALCGAAAIIAVVGVIESARRDDRNDAREVKRAGLARPRSAL